MSAYRMTTDSTTEQTRAVEVWIPALKRGAPSNASGMRGAATPYANRAAALEHEHWSNQAPWATARKVTVTDEPGHLTDEADEVCARILEADAMGGEFDSTIRRAAQLIRSGRRVDGVLAFIGEVAS